MVEQVLDLAKKITKRNDPDEAKLRFKDLINGSSMFYNDGDIPANESDANAHKVCSTAKDAEKYCPKRTAAIKNWFAHTKQVTKNVLFYFNGFILFKQSSIPFYDLPLQLYLADD